MDELLNLIKNIWPGKSSKPQPKVKKNVVKIVFASNNRHKVNEINAIARAFSAESALAANIEFVLPSGSFNPAENGATFIENARIKALAAARAEKSTRFFFLADDSGLCVRALNGEPGLKSARYAATNEESIAKVLKNLEGADNRKAQFVCAMVLCDKTGKVLRAITDVCDGEIAASPQGEGGFGYDPIFTPDGYPCTLAQLNEKEKNKISHRGKALRNVLEWIQANPLQKPD